MKEALTNLFDDSLSEIERLTARLAEAEKRAVEWHGPDIEPRDGANVIIRPRHSYMHEALQAGTYWKNGMGPFSCYGIGDGHDYYEASEVEAWCYESELLATLNIGGKD